MSFSGNVKRELMKVMKPARHCQIAELAAIISLCGDVLIDEKGRYRIRIHTENEAVAVVYEKLLQLAFGTEVRKHVYHQANRGGTIRLLTVTDPAKALEVLQAVKLLDDQGEIREELSSEKNLITQRNCCRRAYVRGAFLAAGSISDPYKSYHFEIVCQSGEKAKQIQSIIDSFGMNAKIVQRKKAYVVYLKESSQITDMMTIMEANGGTLEMENIRILKEMRESVNRKVNCETANINKTVSASVRQIEDISYIKERKGLDYLPESLYDMACMRLTYPDATLKELGELLNPSVGKSGVNHRLRKLSEIAEKLREEQ